MNILFLDTETTGQDENKHQLIQIAAEYHVNGVCVQKFNKRFSPLRTQNSAVNLQALKYNGMGLKQITTLGGTEEAVAAFGDFLLGLKSEKPIIVCGHNVDFDIRFINKMFESFGIEGLNSLISHRKRDTASIGQFLIDRGELKLDSPTLENLAKALEVEVKLESDDKLDILNNRYHNAAYDVAVTAAVYYKMVNLNKKV